MELLIYVGSYRGCATFPPAALIIVSWKHFKNWSCGLQDEKNIGSTDVCLCTNAVVQ